MCEQRTNLSALRVEFEFETEVVVIGAWTCNIQISRQRQCRQVTQLLSEYSKKNNLNVRRSACMCLECEEGI